MAAGEPPPPSSPPLPRRQPKPRQGQPAPDKGEPGPAFETTPSSPGQVGGTGASELQLTQPAAVEPQLPDNVRYLFRPVLNQTDTLAEPVRATSQAVGGELAGVAVTRKSAGQRGAPAGGQGTAADFPDPGGDRPSEPGPDGQAGPPERGGRLRVPAARAASAADGRVRRQLTWAAVVLVVVLTAVGTAIALVPRGPSAGRVQSASSGTQHKGARGSGGPISGAKAIVGLSNAAIIRSRAANWIVRQISSNAIIACDDVMCDQLYDAGLPASDLLVISPNAPDPLGADVVIGTPALRSQFGSRLAGEYAPLVIASFGAGKSLIQVRVVAADGAAAYQSAFNTDLAARQHLGAVLLHNDKLGVSPSAQPDLIAGLVDPRLLAMLPVLAGQHPVQILGFYDQAPRASAGVPFSGVEFAASDPASGLSPTSYRHWLVGFFNGQRAPYEAASVSTARIAGHTVVRVRFARPSPLGLLNGAQ
ncbi:MAG TPA: hypothetical protein VMR14_21090 [Streptosporangiaceae bacterium]|nr:hypothetical protein [Streptosporangiaceae bacterium]